MVTAHIAFSSQVTVAWDANNENNLAGYKIYRGTVSCNYVKSVDVGNKTRHTFSNLQAGVTYYIAVTAYKSAHNESDYSQELIYTVPIQAPVASFIAKPAFGEAPLTVKFDAGETYDLDGRIVNYEWNFGDGGIEESGPIVYHHFTEAGSYNVVLTATDDDGFQAEASYTVEAVVPPLDPVEMVFKPFISKNLPTYYIPTIINWKLPFFYLLTFDVTGITDPIQDSNINLFFDNDHDRIAIFYDNNLITTVEDVAAKQWYDIDIPDIITENKPYTF
ncbi:MAG: PKD domain-containing protein, partial [bacterium]|nr:PKD domain-containing protein [bacterium]